MQLSDKGTWVRIPPFPPEEALEVSFFCVLPTYIQADAGDIPGVRLYVSENSLSVRLLLS